MKIKGLVFAIVAVLIVALAIVWINGRQTPEFYAKSGAVVAVQNTIFNADKLEQYFTDEAQGIKSIRIVRYTVEGDPVIMDVAYENGAYSLVVDATKDRFSVKDISVYNYNHKSVMEEKDGRTFVLHNDYASVKSGNTDDYFELLRIGNTN